MNHLSPQSCLSFHTRGIYLFYLLFLLSIPLAGTPNFDIPSTYFTNIDNGGSIGYNQTICFGETPTEIQSLASASGGNAGLEVEYLWLQSIPGIQDWTAIDGATNATYDPGVLSQTTAFMRCARRMGFDNFTGESNVILITVKAPPIVSILSAPTFGVAGDALNFEASYLPFVSYTWNFGDNSTAEGRSVSHIYNFGNAYEVTLTLEDSFTGCSITIPVQVLTILGPLPVEMAYFKANALHDELVDLEWATENEENNAFFIVQHSDDGTSFRTLDVQQGKGTSNTFTAYHFQHDTPIIGQNYYRLKQVDFDGKYVFSEVIEVSIQKENAIAVTAYPNPFVETIHLRLKEPSHLPVMVSIFNTNHQEVKQAILPAFEAKVSVPMENLPSGLYIVKVKARTFHSSHSIYKAD